MRPTTTPDTRTTLPEATDCGVMESVAADIDRGNLLFSAKSSSTFFVGGCHAREYPPEIIVKIWFNQ